MKYEKLPLICFYCGMLGHGTNDCKEVFGTHSPVKNFGPWLKASPWRPISTEETGEESRVGQKCGRKLFFTKKLEPVDSMEKSLHHNILDMASLLDKVVIKDNNDKNLEETNLQTLMDKVGSPDLVNTNEILVKDDGGQVGSGTSSMGMAQCGDIAHDVSGSASCDLSEDKVAQGSAEFKVSSRTGGRIQKWKKLGRDRASQDKRSSGNLSVGGKRSYVGTVDKCNYLHLSVLFLRSLNEVIVVFRDNSTELLQFLSLMLIW